jgi:hypothetical protein
MNYRHRLGLDQASACFSKNQYRICIFEVYTIKDDTIKQVRVSIVFATILDGEIAHHG